MKHLIIMFLVVGAIMMFFGCSEDNPVEPVVNQSDQGTNSLQKGKVETPFGFKGKKFTGVCTKTMDPDFEEVPGIKKELPNGKMLKKGRTTVWHDATDDPRVSGNTYWYIDQKFEQDGTFKYWGKAELIVDNDGGRWAMSWHGYLTPDGLIAEGVGQGKEGDVKGLVAKWTYTFDFVNRQYDIVGYINE